MDNNPIDPERVEAVAARVRQAAIDSLGEKLDKVYLYDVNVGAYDGPDFSFLIVAHIPENETAEERSKIRKHTRHVDLEHEVLYYCRVTGSDHFYKYANTSESFKSAVEEGTLLYG